MSNSEHDKKAILTTNRKVLIHVLFWAVYGLINYQLSYSVMASYSFSIGFVLVTLLINLGLVYFHLLYLLPDYFMTGKYKQYFGMVLLAIICASTLRLLGLDGVGSYTVIEPEPSFAYKTGMSLSSSFIILLITMPFFLLEEWLKKTAPITVATAANDGEQKKAYFFIKSDNKLVKIYFDDISYVESLRDLVRIHAVSGRYLSQHSMRKMVEILPEEQFMRVHRSYIISFNKVQAVSGNRVEIGELKIPIGKTYREDFFQRLEVL